MPAPRMYIGTAEIASLLSVSGREAQRIMKVFELRGQTAMTGRLRRVSLKTFARYLSDQDGSDPGETYDELKAAIKSA